MRELRVMKVKLADNVPVIKALLLTSTVNPVYQLVCKKIYNSTLEDVNDFFLWYQQQSALLQSSSATIPYL